jgi:hypothetical protein
MRPSLAFAAPALVGFALASTAAAAPAGKSHAVSIFAPRGISADCARVLPLKRVVAEPRLLRGAMQALLAGPTKAERARGYGGWFSVGTAGHLRGVWISDGVASIDFRSFASHIPNASTSCVSTLLLAQLDRTARQFSAVKRAIYSFSGSRQAFCEWVQREPPGAER